MTKLKWSNSGDDLGSYLVDSLISVIVYFDAIENKGYRWEYILTNKKYKSKKYYASMDEAKKMAIKSLKLKIKKLYKWAEETDE